jgi:Flp pilus assembly protein TadG
VRLIRKTTGSGSGQALIEFALVLPLLFLLIINVVNFGGLLYAWVVVSNAARTGTQRLMMGGATVHSPTPPSLSEVAALVQLDLSSLRNRASAQVKVCKNNNGTTTCSGSGGAAPPADPEATFFVSGSVDVTYTYQPFVTFWSFPKLGIYMTLGTTNVHRQAVMRLGGG